MESLTIAQTHPRWDNQMFSGQRKPWSHPHDPCGDARRRLDPAYRGAWVL